MGKKYKELKAKAEETQIQSVNKLRVGMPLSPFTGRAL